MFALYAVTVLIGNLATIYCWTQRIKVHLI